MGVDYTGKGKVEKLPGKWQGHPKFMQQQKATVPPRAGEAKDRGGVIRAPGRSWNFLQVVCSSGAKTMEEI